MTDRPLTAEDYPVAEKRPGRVVGARGKSLDDLTMEAVIGGAVEMEDLRITPQALLLQAQVAKSVGRAALAANFERAAEMTKLPQPEIMRIYELLRPGRAESRQTLLDAARRLREEHDAETLAAFVEEAALLYDRRGLFQSRF